MSPSDDSTVGSNPIFTWTSVRGERNYLIQVTDISDTDFNSPLINETVLDTSYQSPNILPDGSYVWRVRTEKGKRVGAWSSIYSFTLATFTTDFFDDFSSYPSGNCLTEGADFGPWTVLFNGFGCVKIDSDGFNQRLHESPQSSSSTAESHSSLVIGPYFAGPLLYEAYVATIEQLRTGTDPYPWEVAWVLWNYTHNDHYYYFIPKPNGWELGKRDPQYPGGQRFLSTGSEPIFPIGNEYIVTIEQDSSNKISVYVNGFLITTFTDTEDPYTSGNIGLYNEDAHVHFDDVNVTQ